MRKKIVTILLMILCLISFLGCSSTKLVYIKPNVFEFQKTKELKVRGIRVLKEDAELFKAYIKALRRQNVFHNQQIDDYYRAIKDDEIQDNKQNN